MAKDISHVRNTLLLPGIRQSHGDHLEDEGVEGNPLYLGGRKLLELIVVLLLIQTETDTRTCPTCTQIVNVTMETVITLS